MIALRQGPEARGEWESVGLEVYTRDVDALRAIVYRAWIRATALGENRKSK